MHYLVLVSFLWFQVGSVTSAALAAKPPIVDNETAKSSSKEAPSLGKSVAPKQTLMNPSVSSIPSGCFQMGSPESEPGRGNDEALHRVCVKGFKLSKTEVTVEEFGQFIAATHYSTDAENNVMEPGCWSYQSESEKPWDWRAGASWKQPIQSRADLANNPVTCVSYNDVMAYITWLNQSTGHEYRLPTEAEWEYAARAGTTMAHYWGNNSDIACGYANVADNTQSGPFKWPVSHSCEDGYFFTAAVKSFPANNFQLYDMLGNAWEWVCSKYEDNYTGVEQTCLGLKPADDVLISIRGGGWNADAARVRAAHRNWGVAWSRQANLGFRLVRVR
jgi:serine/threonine-protein kinase PpkA